MNKKIIRQPIVTVLGHVDSGKCISGDMIISPYKQTIRELFNKWSELRSGIGLKIISFDPYTHSFKYTISYHMQKEFAEKIVRVKFSDNSILETTPEHSYLVYRGNNIFQYVRAINLKDGMEIVALDGLNSPFQMTTKKVRSLAIYRDGNYDVYDLSSPYHNFIAESIVVHNTSLLDKIRGTAVQLKEAGGITQHIGASLFPKKTLIELCKPLLKKFKFEVTVPGILVIDTPGHEVFSNLRRRGGSASDIAILVVDITKGFEPQTHESIQILINRKVPFLVAANKVDLIHGWKPHATYSILESLSKQRKETLLLLEERLAYIISALNTYKFNADRFDRIKDFKKYVAIVPISAKTGEGIQELLTILIGLVQRFMLYRLEVDLNKAGYGVVLEVSSEHGLGKVLKAIHIDGVVRRGDTLIVGGSEGVITRKIRSILMPAPLDEIRAPRKKFKSIDESYPAAGIIITAPNLESVYAGSSFYSVSRKEEVSKYINEISKEISSIKIESDKVGVVIKADTLGSLEAFVLQCKRLNIPVRKADVGSVSKKDIVEAEIVKRIDDLKGVVLAFNVGVNEEAEELAKAKNIPIFRGDILYRIIEEYRAWVYETFSRRKKIEFENLVKPGKIKVLEGYIFRRSKPAIFGIRVLGGVIRQKYKLINKEGKIIGSIHQIQSMGKNIQEATKDMEVAISVREAIVGKDINEGDILYVDIPEDDAKKLLKEFYSELDEDSRKVFKEILEIKRKKNPLWARG